MPLVQTNFQQQGINALNQGLGIGRAIQNTQQIGIDRQRQAEMDAQRNQQFQSQQGIMGQQSQMNQQTIDQNNQTKGMGELITALNLPFDKRNELFAELEASRTSPDSKKYLAHLQTLDDEEQLTSMIQLLNSRKGGQKDGRTEKIKNFDQWSAMIDGPEKEAFAQSAGLADKTKKRLFKIVDNDDGTVTKYYADGTEEIKSDSDNIVMAGMKKPMSYKKAIGVLDKAKESQSKNGGFALTMDRGLRTIQELDKKGFDPKDISMVQTYLAGKPLGSYIMTPDEQIYSGAIESMINAIARRESGAAIGEEETQRFFGRYMPQAGDSEQRIKQKRKALEGQFMSIRGQSGSVFDALKVTIGENPIEATPQPSAGNADATELSNEDMLKLYGG